MLLAQNSCILDLLVTMLIGNPMLEVEPTGQRGRMATGSGQNGPDIGYRFAAVSFMAAV